MPRRMLIFLGFSAATIAIGCNSRAPAPQPGPLYATAQVRGVREQESPTAQTLAGAAWLQSRQSVRLGEFEYDGLTLPLIAPDAHALATQTGQAPAWEAVLAQGSAPAPSCAIKIYAIAPRGHAPLMHRLTLPSGLLLGRAANNRGFLVERPAQSGSPRRIGFAAWNTGEVEWLTDETADAAFATLGPDGTLAYCRRGSDSQVWTLVCRVAGGAEVVATVPGCSILFPVLTSTDRGPMILAIIADEVSGTSLRLASFEMLGSGTASPGALTMVADAPIGAPSSVYGAYQCMASVPAYVPRRESADRARVLVFSPAAARLALVEVTWGERTTLRLRELVPGTSAGTLLDSSGLDGIVACTPLDTFYLDVAGGSLRPGMPPPALIWPKAGIPLGLESPDWCLAMVFTQTSSTRTRLQMDLISNSGAAEGE